MNDLYYMEMAISIASSAAHSSRDVPIAALVVRDSDGEILGIGCNTREDNNDSTGHAEINAIRAACERIGSWRLSGCSLFVTLEPCPMCAGACVNARLSRVVFALKDPKAGAFGSVLNLNSYPLNHKPTILCGLCEDKAGDIISSFFKNKRG